MAEGINNHFLTISYGNCRPRAYNVLASSRAVNCESRILFSYFFFFCKRIRNTWKRANELIHCSIRKKKKGWYLGCRYRFWHDREKKNIRRLLSFFRSNFKTLVQNFIFYIIHNVHILDILNVPHPGNLFIETKYRGRKMKSE